MVRDLERVAGREHGLLDPLAPHTHGRASEALHADTPARQRREAKLKARQSVAARRLEGHVLAGSLVETRRVALAPVGHSVHDGHERPERVRTLGAPNDHETHGGRGLRTFSPRVSCGADLGGRVAAHGV